MRETQSKQHITSTTTGSTGPNATEKFTADWWKSQSEEQEFQGSIEKIKYILGYTGKWNRNARILEVQCGLGSMPQYMYDNGFLNYAGIDNSAGVADTWDNHDILYLLEPDNTGFDDQLFHIVCWFSMGDGRIEQDRIPDVLEEMSRVGHGTIIVKPFDIVKKGSDTEFLAFMLEHGWSCSDVNPVNKFFLFHRE